MKKTVRMLSFVLALAMVLSVVSGVAAFADDNSYVVIAQTSEVANLNPMEYPRTPDSNVQAMIFSYLVQPDASLTFQPDLAESWDISEDGRFTPSTCVRT